MTVIEKNLFVAEDIDNYNVRVYKNYSYEHVDIANVIYDPEIKNCYIKTVCNNFQDNVVEYNDFCDFIRVIDESYDYLNLKHRNE